MDTPLRASIVIATHNEGDLLWRTVKSCAETSRGLDYEVVVVDDASTDDCIAQLRRRFPEVSVTCRRKRGGPSPSKDAAARRARGKVLVFLDGHCKPERDAIARLVEDVEERDGKAILVPKVPVLDGETWKNRMLQAGEGYRFRLDSFESDWMPRERMWLRGRFYESPGLCGCCFAMSRDLYLKLRGFDKHMVQWGVEDLDLALKAWLMGYPILYDPTAVIGHRFRDTFDTYAVADESILCNQLRSARKNLADDSWRDWVRLARARWSRGIWRKAWALFKKGEPSVERERDYLLRHRVADEFWYARRFELDWPRDPSRS